MTLNQHQYDPQLTRCSRCLRGRVLASHGEQGACINCGWSPPLGPPPDQADWFREEQEQIGPSRRRYGITSYGKMRL